MKQKFVTINGVNYPIVFDLQALTNFEDITKLGFFEANLNTTNNRIAIVIGAAISADKNTALTVEEMRGKETFDDYEQIVEAYNVVMTLANDFFKIPKVEEGKDPKPEEQEQEQEENVKN